MPDLIVQYGLALIFVNVLVERIGLPVPATPTLVLGGALAAVGQLSAGDVFGLAFVACVIGDTLWYGAGVVFGRRVISLLCRISVSPDSCVRLTETRFTQWGPLTLVCAKFVPGLSTVVRPLAGIIHLGWWRFELYNGIGTALWVGASVAAGWIFHDELNRLMTGLRDFGVVAFGIVAVLAGAFIAVKWWRRRRFARMLHSARITVQDLRELMSRKPAPIIVDLRSPMTRGQDGRRIPGARVLGLDELATRIEEFPHDRDIVFYCSCPNEASAAYAARQLIDLGYTRVRPLLGGLDAWVAAGYEVETDYSPPLNKAAA
ncbi:MAG TPA: DedA family protein/thiosulfate sulfurtransferase GlpE [Steroidobacteraceae bacterium]|nr:DedA family protein/thiosulfate sulfurtransferase GlpE [Steroidobacteraceae bacterium]